MKWTTERCVPDDMFEFPWTYTYHLMNYAFAVQFCSKKNVIDLACGTGYGLQMMQPLCKSISGGDICSETLEYARRFNNDKVILKQIDLEKQTILDVFKRKYDVITSLESIEHFANPEFFLQNVYNALEDDGLFILLIPVHSVTPYHKVLFNYGNALVTGDKIFKNIRVMIQRGDSLIPIEVVDPDRSMKILDSKGTMVLKVMGKQNGNIK